MCTSSARSTRRGSRSTTARACPTRRAPVFRDGVAEYDACGVSPYRSAIVDGELDGRPSARSPRPPDRRRGRARRARDSGPRSGQDVPMPRLHLRERRPPRRRRSAPVLRPRALSRRSATTVDARHPTPSSVVADESYELREPADVDRDDDRPRRSPRHARAHRAASVDSAASVLRTTSSSPARVVAHGAPRSARDLEDHERDREADERVGERRSRAQTPIALTTTPSETKPSTRAWFPSAISAGLASRRPARSRTCAAISFPTKPRTPAAASAPQVRQRLRIDEAQDRLVQRDARRDEDREDDEQARDLLGAEGAEEERDPDRDRRRARRRSCARGRREARPSPSRTKIAVCTRAVTPRIARLTRTARMPARERMIERSTRPCE